MSEHRKRQINVQMPDALRLALTRAAERRFTNVSEYIRSALVDRLRSDQVQIEPTSASPPAPVSSPVEQVA